MCSKKLHLKSNISTFFLPKSRGLLAGWGPVTANARSKTEGQGFPEAGTGGKVTEAYAGLSKNPLVAAPWHQHIHPPTSWTAHIHRGNNVDLVLCVLLGHQNSKIANSMKLVNFALFSSQYHVFELKNIRGNLIAPNSNRWSLSNKIAMSQEDNRKIISLFGQEKSIFLHPWMLKDLM